MEKNESLILVLDKYFNSSTIEYSILCDLFPIEEKTNEKQRIYQNIINIIAIG